MNRLAPEDVVPALRSDLVIEPRVPPGEGAEVISLGCEGSDERTRLHGFEFSIARMLDGERSATDIMRNCALLGLPMSLRSLEGFVRELELHGLLTASGRPARRAGAGAIAPRASWDPVVRDAYRTALRCVREGRPEEAVTWLDELLAAAPQTQEAADLRTWIARHHTAVTNATGFRQLYRDTQRTWRSYLPEGLGNRLPSGKRIERAARAAAKPALKVALAAAAVVAALAVPLPRAISASARLTPFNALAVRAPHGGVVDKVWVREGDAVAEGSPLYSWDVSDAQVRLAELQGVLEDARAPSRAAVGRTPEGVAAWANLQDAERDLARAQYQLLTAQRTAGGAEADETSLGYERHFETANARVAEARAAVDALAAPGTRDSAEFAALTRDIEELRAELAAQSVVAPATGVVRQLAVRPGQKVTQDDALLQLDELGKLKMVASATPRLGRRVQVGEPMTVRLGDARIATRVDAVSDYEIEATLPNESGALWAGTRAVELALSPRSLWQRLR